MKIDLYMKNDQKNVTNLNMSFAFMLDHSKVMNIELLTTFQ